jgi:hypothetical protein
MLFEFCVLVLSYAIKFTQEINPSGIGPTPRDSASIAYSPKTNFVYIFGGKSTVDLDDLWVFDLGSLLWNIIYPNSPSPRKIYIESRSNAGGFYYSEQDEFCIYGGSSALYVFNDLWCYSIKYKMWKEKRQNFSPPPMLNFAYKHFVKNESEYFVIVGHQVSSIIVESYM